jgi:predicted amidohydrolase
MQQETASDSDKAHNRQPADNDSLRIAVLQHTPIPRNIKRTIQQLSERASEAADKGAQLLIVPEASMTGYNISLADMKTVAQTEDGELSDRVAEICGKFNIAIAYAFAEQYGSAYFNCVQVMDAAGHLCGKYRKTHLWGDLDRTLFSAGTDLTPTFTLDGWRLGLLICYDIEFPECARRLTLEGAELLVVPTGLMKPWREVAEMVVPVRAYENQIYVAYTNYCGNEGDLTYEGRSCIVGPDGKDIARADSTTPTLLTATLSKTALAETRSTLPYHRDRRPELYKPLTPA